MVQPNEQSIDESEAQAEIPVGFELHPREEPEAQKDALTEDLITTTS
jgi:hypothetical protein